MCGAGAAVGGGVIRGIGIDGAPPDNGGLTGIEERIGGSGIEGTPELAGATAFGGSCFAASGFSSAFGASGFGTTAFTGGASDFGETSSA